MTIEDKLTDIMNAKEDIKDAINQKGVEVTNKTYLSEYANKIRQIDTDTDWGEIGGYIENQTDLIYRLSTKQDTITDLDTIRDGASKGATALQSIPIARANVVGGVAGGNWLVVNQTTGKMECGELTKAQYDSALGYTFISKTTLENRLVNKADLSAVDGPWVVNNIDFITANTTLTANVAQTFDISDVIPNDGHQYTLIINATGQTGTTSGDSAEIIVDTDLTAKNCRIARAQTRSSSSVPWGGCVILPVGAGRTVSIRQNGSMDAICRFFRVIAYRRCGLNS